MKYFKLVANIVLVAIIVLTTSSIFAKQNNGKSNNASKGQKATKSANVPVTPASSSENPPGWSKGKKVGWQGEDQPPGLEKKPSERDTSIGESLKDSAKEVKDYFENLFGIQK